MKVSKERPRRLNVRARDTERSLSMLFQSTLPLRFWARVYADSSGCWLWMGPTTDQGYGQYSMAGRTGRVHRFSYISLVGAIPPSLQIDHLCRRRHCVNPRHLEPVSRRENILRGEGASAINARKVKCKRGHDFTGWRGQWRKCLICMKLHNRLRTSTRSS